MKDNEGASFVGAAFCLMQDAPIDKAMYYDAYPQRTYCGLYHFPGPRTTQTYSAFVMWNRLYRLGGQIPARTDAPGVYACAAANKSEKALFIANFNAVGCKISLDLTGAKLKDFSGRIIDKRHDNAPFALQKEIVLPPYSVLLMDTGKTDSVQVKTTESSSNHAGLDDGSVKEKKR